MTQTETNDNHSNDIPTATPIGTLSSSYPTTKSSQNQQWAGAVVSSPTTPITLIPSSEEDGKGLGIALFVVLLVGILINIVLPPVSLVCTITAIVLSSILSCGCCCADYKLSKKRRQLANAILISLCLMVILQVISVSIWLSGFGYNVDQRVSIIIMLVLSYMLNITAIVLSAIFTWGKSCGKRRPINTTVVKLGRY